MSIEHEKLPERDRVSALRQVRIEFEIWKDLSERTHEPQGYIDAVEESIRILDEIIHHRQKGEHPDGDS